MRTKFKWDITLVPGSEKKIQTVVGKLAKSE